VSKNPDLAIVPSALWKKAQERRDATRERFGSHRNTDGRLHGRPEAGLIAAHLLNGFLVCGVCGGSLSFMSKNGRTHRYYCQRRVSRGRHTCTNAKGVLESELDRAVVEALHKVVQDPEVAWALVVERAERWKRERSLTVDARAELKREEARLEAVIERLLDNLEAGDDVGLRLKKRREELDALRVRLAEPEGLDIDEARFESELAKTTEWLNWHGPLAGSWTKDPRPGDVAQTRAALRALGVQKIIVTPVEGGGWRFQGDGSLAGMAGVLGDTRRPSRPPIPITRTSAPCGRPRRPSSHGTPR
jgi:Recombinase zinc beta ribbon domain